MTSPPDERAGDAPGEHAAVVATGHFSRDRTTLVLYAALGVFGCLQTVPGLVAPALRSELGYGYTTASLHVTVFAALGTLAGLLAPRLDQRYGRRAVLLLGLLGFAAGAAGLTAGREAATTLAAAGVAGLLGTLIIVAVQAALADAHGERRAVAFSESNVVASAGSTLAPLAVGAAAAQLGSWRWGILGLAATGVAVSVLVVRAVLPRTTAGVATPDRGGRLPAAALAGTALLFTGVLVELSTSYWGATYLREVVGLSPPAAVTGMTCFFGAMLAGRVAVGALVRVVDPAHLVAAGLSVAATGLVLAGASTDAPAALLGLVLLGLGVAGLFPLALSLAVSAAPDRAALVSGRCVVAGSLAVVVGPLLVGQLADVVGLRAALGLLPAAVVAAGLLLAQLVRRR